MNYDIMTPEQLQIAVCEASGWRMINTVFWIHPFTHPQGMGRRGNLPDLTLDFMHEREKELTTTEQQNQYQSNIAEICYADEERANNQVVFNQLTATARQRAIAWLKVKEEGK